MWSELKRAVLFTLCTMALFGIAYPIAVWGVAQIAFPAQAQGSMVRRADGTIAGSSLIGQGFKSPQYFHSRPSAVDYNAASTGGSNYGPSNPDHRKLTRERLDAVVAENGVQPTAVPSEIVTASGGGLDPHLPPEAIELQVNRVARARNVSADDVRTLVHAQTEGPLWGVFGRSRVNVLELNLALDTRFGPRK
jgi:potassium-transporting ATPase KdpC subunit